MKARKLFFLGRSFFILLLLVLRFVFIHTEGYAEQNVVRMINVCILNDAYHTVSSLVIDASIAKAFEEYRQKTGIRFIRYEFLQFTSRVNQPPYADYYLRDRCSVDSEIRILFSNFKKMESKKEKGIYGEKIEKIREIKGLAYEHSGIIILYNAEYNFNFRDASGGRALITTLKHELAHLFGVDHIVDTRYFMHPEASIYSLGGWSPEIIRTITRNVHKTWHH